MQGFDHTAASTHVSDKDKVPRHLLFKKVEIDCLVPGQTLGGMAQGYVLRMGKQTIVVGEQNLAAIEMLTEYDPEAVAVAKAAYESRVDAAFAADRDTKGTPLFVQHNGGKRMEARDVTAARKRVGKSPEPWDAELLAERAAIALVTGLSWQGVFRELNNRDALPILSCTVVEDKLIHPEEIRRQEFIQEQAERTAAILGQAQRANGGTQPRGK